MSEIEFIDTKAHSVHALVLIEANDSVWLTHAPPWWDIASWFWWWLTAGEKKYVQIKNADNTKVRIRAVKLSAKHIRVGSGGAAKS